MLERLTQRFRLCSDLEATLACALSAGLELTDATLGNVQLMDWSSGYLGIAAQHGFGDRFLRLFRRVDARSGSACGRAVRDRRAVIVDDVMSDPEFAPFRTVALEAGFRAVQSTPIISSSGAFVGILSTHFASPHRPSRREIAAMATAAELTGNAVIRQRVRQRERNDILAGVKGANQAAGQIQRSIDAVEGSRALLRRISASGTQDSQPTNRNR